ncbi:MAG: hypothetical protein KC448_14005 [Yoonia sp.]|nr:hypothetical protein [Yoonia sp.]
MRKTNPPRQSILVGAGSFVDAAAALRVVEKLPSSFRANLGGVLIEELDTFAACQIPKQRIILLSGTTTLAPSQSQVRTLIEADARAFQSSLARAADPNGTNWVFAQYKGELVGTSLRAAKGWDILVIGYRRVHKIQGKVILLTALGRSSDEMDLASRNLSQQFAVDRIAFSVKTDASDAARQLHSNAIEFDTFNDCLSALTRTNALAVLVDLKRGPVRNQIDLARLLEAARCPLIVFGASGAHALLEHSIQIPPITARGPPGSGV